MPGRGLISVVVLVFCLLAPAGAVGADGEFEGVFESFSVKASHGYRVNGVATSDRVDGRGELILYVHRNNVKQVALYRAEATVTPTHLEADLGALGRVDLELVSTGAKRTARAWCGEPVTFEEASYRGIFEFRGEESFTRADASRLAVDPRAFIDLFVCQGFAVLIETPRLQASAGARLRVLSKPGKRSAVDFEVVKNRPGAPTLIRTIAREERRGVAITRGLITVTRSSAFAYDRALRTATVKPPAPFSGAGAFHINGKAGNQWVGNLTVDLPGRANIPLAKPGLAAILAPAAWSRG